MAFSDNLQFLRARQGLTQEQLAQALSVSRQSVSKWESSASFPEMDTVMKLCDIFSVSMDTLLRGDAAAQAEEDTAGYDRFMNGFARKISLSVGAIIAGTALTAALSGLGVSDMLCGCLFLVIVAISVTVLVASGIQHTNFRKRNPVIQDFYTQEQKNSFHNRFVYYIAGSVGVIILGLALVPMIFHFLPEDAPYDHLVGAGSLLVVAVAVAVIVWAGIMEDKYKIDKYNRISQRELYPTEDDKRRNQRVGRICGAIMILATAIYVCLGLTRNLWGTAWWLFPVGGILCGVVSILLGPAEEE